MSSTQIIIFAKAPVPGFAKSRLIPALGEIAAAQLARRMLLHTIEQALLSDATTVELCATPAVHPESWEGIPIDPALVCTEQGQGDLGDRLARACSRASAVGRRAILVGIDCPSLDVQSFQKAMDALEKNDCVLIPSFDGGYALLGLKSFHHSLFEGIQWSTASVAAETQHRIAALSWTLGILPMLHDIDEPCDLQWLPDAWK